MYDVAIIGAGVVGGMLARTLAAYDLNVCILEKENDVAMGASRANSGIVHAGYDAEEGTLKAKLNVRGSEMMETVAKELGVPYRKNGSLVIGFGEEDRATVEKLYARGIANGVKDLRIVDGEEARELEPGLSDEVTCALYAPTCAIICPYELTIAAVGNAMDNGVRLITDFEVRRIVTVSQKPQDADREETCGQIYEIYGNSNKYTKDTDNRNCAAQEPLSKVCARYVVNASGIHADEIAGMAGDTSIQLHPRRGEYILLDRECGNLVSHTIFRTPSARGKGILITPTVDGNILLGPTSTDMEDKEDKATTAEGFAQITERGRENLKTIPFNKTITSFCGLRAVGNTGDFIITSPKPGFINAAGIESPGLTAAPAIAEYIVSMLADQGLVLRQRRDYQPLRTPVYAFRDLSPEEKNRVIQRDKSYGRVICRCETVTEGEIVAAIHANPPARDMDGIKRRTRAQMGRCQGGFCMPYLTEILARELGIPYEAVTKSGGASRLITGRTKERGAQ